MTFPFSSPTPAAPPPLQQQWLGVCLSGVDESQTCGSSDGASSSTCSSVCTSADWENNRGRRSEVWKEKTDMPGAWRTDAAALSAPLQQERKLQQQYLSRYAQQQQQQAKLYGVAPQQQQQLCARLEAQPFFPQDLQGPAAAAAAAPVLQQPLQQQQQVLADPSHPLLQQTPLPLVAQQEQHLQPQHLQQQCLQHVYIPQQSVQYVLPVSQQTTLQQHMLQTYVQQQQHLQACGCWPSAKKERFGDPLVRLTITVMKYRCRHAASRRGQTRERGSSDDVGGSGSSNSKSPADGVDSSSSSSSSSSSTSSSSRRQGSSAAGGSGAAGGSRGPGESGSGGSSSNGNSVGGSSSSSSGLGSSMLFFGGKRTEKGSQKKSGDEVGGCMALQPFTVTYSAAVHASLLESLPLFGCMHSDIFGVPRRVVLLAFEQEDHVSAETLWRLLEFCCLLRTHAAAAAFCSRAAGAADDDAGALSREGAGDAAAAQEATAASSGVAAAAAQFVARMPVERLLLTYAGCLLLLNKLQGVQQQQEHDALEEERQQQQQLAVPLSQPFVHAQQQQPLLHPQSQQHSSYAQPNSHYNSYTQQQEQGLPFQWSTQQGQEQQQQQLLLHGKQQQQNGVAQGNGWETGSLEGCTAAAAPADGASGSGHTAAAAAKEEQQVTPLLVLQHVRDAGAAKLQRLLDEALLPVCCCIAHRYDDLRLLASCYWLLRHILLEKGLPPEWKEPSQQQQQLVAAAPAAAVVGGGTASKQQTQQQPEDAGDVVTHQTDQGGCTQQQLPQGQQQQQPQQPLGQQPHISCQPLLSQPQLFAQQQLAPDFTHAAGGGQVDTCGAGVTRQRSEDDSWMPQSLFARCTGRKACFSVHDATLQHLSYVVPLTVFWRVVADEVRRKSAFLAEPRGYLHCEIRRLRTPSGSSFVYPHAYFLFADAASCRQLGLQQQLAMQQQPQQVQQPQHRQGADEQRKTETHGGPVMLLFGRRQSEYSAVDFFLPSPALLEAASRCSFDSEHEGAREKAAGAHQQLLAAAGAAEIYGRDYLGTLNAGFWGTRFSLRHWGMKQPCRLEGGGALPSPLALSSEVDAPYSFSAAAAASTAAATAATNGRAAASSSKKIIYTRLVRVYQQPADLQGAAVPPLAAAAQAQQLQQNVLQQQQYTTQQQQGSFLEQYTLQQQQQQAYGYMLYQGQPQQEYGLLQPEQQGRSVHENVKHEETAGAPEQEASSGVDLYSSQQAQQQQRISDKKEESENGVPFFFCCSRSHDEALPAAGEVAEVLTAEQSQRSSTSSCGSNSGGKGDPTQREAAAAAGAPAAAARRGSSSQEELRPIHVVPHQQESELCSIEFETNLRGDLPRQMSVKLLRDSGSYNLESVKPRWDESIRAYSLPFFGRAKVPSAKNVQLTPSRMMDSSIGAKKRNKGKRSSRRQAGHGALGAAASTPAASEADEADDEEANTSIYLMMGKLSKDVFALDFRAPVRIFEAFAIAAATLAKKRAVS